MATITLNPDDLAATRTNLGLGTAAVLQHRNVKRKPRGNR